MIQPEYFELITADIRSNPEFDGLKSVTHHGGDNSLYEHSIRTARLALRLAILFHMRDSRIESVTRAALLHDFFGYDWHGPEHKEYVRSARGLRRIPRMHAFSHGPAAAEHASSIFELTDRQRSAIATHMFPLAGVPRNSEGWIVTLADKITATEEVLSTAIMFIRNNAYGIIPAGHTGFRR